MPETAGKISALCLIGPEKAVSASNFSARAIATEPIRPDVSTANIKGFCFIMPVLSSYVFGKGLIMPIKRGLKLTIFPSFPKFNWRFADLKLDIIGQSLINQFFPCKKVYLFIDWPIIGQTYI